MCYRTLFEVLRPGNQPLGSADKLKKFERRQGLQVRLGESSGEFCPWRLRGQDSAFALPLCILGRLTGHQLPEKEVNHTGTHRLHWSLKALQRFRNIVHDAMVFEHIFEHKVRVPRSGLSMARGRRLPTKAGTRTLTAAYETISA